MSRETKSTMEITALESKLCDIELKLEQMWKKVKNSANHTENYRGAWDNQCPN